VGIIIERITALVVPHLSVKYAENVVDIITLNLFRELLTKPLNVAIREIRNHVGINPVSVLIVGIEHRVPYNVFGKAVGLNLA
jgi:hypothetical protein